MSNLIFFLVSLLILLFVIRYKKIFVILLFVIVTGYKNHLSIFSLIEKMRNFLLFFFESCEKRIFLQHKISPLADENKCPTLLLHYYVYSLPFLENQVMAFFVLFSKTKSRILSYQRKQAVEFHYYLMPTFLSVGW